MINLFKSFDKLKTNAISLFGGVYALGYLSWSYYSYENNLGHISTFEVQYFVAGLAPALLIVYLTWFFVYRKVHAKQIAVYLKSRPNFLRIPFHCGLAIVLLKIILPDGFWNPFTHLSGFLHRVPVGVINVSIFLGINIFLLIFPSLVQYLSRKKGGSADKYSEQIKEWAKSVTNAYLWVWQWVGILFALVIVVLMVLIFFTELYPGIPQEIGGVRPKQAIMLVDASDILYSDRKFVLLDTTNASSATTDTLLVYFYNDSKMIFKLKVEDKKLLPKNPSYEIERSKIKSIKWLE